MEPSMEEPGPTNVKPAPIVRAESAPPTRGRDEFEKPKPLPKAAPAPSCRPPTNPARTKAANGSNTGVLKRPKRMLPRDPMALRCSLAMSRTESVLVSSSGDVMVCRCRRSSTPYLGGGGSGYYSDIARMDPWTNLIPCCDADFIVDGPWSPVFNSLTPWSPVFNSLTVQKKKSSESAGSEASTYDWESGDRPKLPIKPPSTTPETIEASRTKALADSVMDLRPESTPTAPASTRRGIVRESAALPSPVPSPYYQPPTMETLMDFNAYDGEILPLPSFDYDHIHQGQNDMLANSEEVGSNGILTPRKSGPQAPFGTPGAMNRRKKSNFPTILESPEEKKDEASSPNGQVQTVHQPFYHGIPIFLTSLSQIRISKVSSHPLGAHVLMISEEAMLFSYGLNNHGQLGIGVRTNVKDATRGFRTTPTLITPLLENGGKAIHCAAGVDHSLVVVATEGRRLHRLQTKPGVAYSDHGAILLSNSAGAGIAPPAHNNNNNSNATDDQDSVTHQQLYGFGSNDFMKIGLVRARLADDGSEGDGEDILLPRRVALHCTVWPQKDHENNSNSPDRDEVDLPPQGIFDIAASAEHSAALVRRATGDIEVYMWGNATLGALGLPVTQDPDIETQDGATQQRPAFKANNIFPLPTVLERLSFRPHQDSPLGFPRQVALGPHCSFVVMSTGRCASFGFSAEGMLGHGFGLAHTMDVKEVRFPPQVGDGNGIVSVNAGAHHVIALTAQGEAYSWGINSDDRLGHGTSDYAKFSSNPDVNASSKENLVVIEWKPQKIDMTHSLEGTRRGGDASHCVVACAGYDSSMLVTRSGEVLSFGKRSGRLGKGEVAHDVSVPEPLHGGLRLFRNRKAAAEKEVTRVRTKPLLKRILSDGAFK